MPYRVESNCQFDRNTKLAQARHHVRRRYGTPRMPDDDDRANLTALVISNRLVGFLFPQRVIEKRRMDALLVQPDFEFVHSQREYVEQAPNEIDVGMGIRIRRTRWSSVCRGN